MFAHFEAQRSRSRHDLQRGFGAESNLQTTDDSRRRDDRSAVPLSLLSTSRWLPPRPLHQAQPPSFASSSPAINWDILVGRVRLVHQPLVTAARRTVVDSSTCATSTMS